MKSAKIVGGRFVIVECTDIEKVVKFYTDNKFIYLQKPKELVQLVRYFPYSEV